jgi:hypothetical protein
MGLLDLKKLIIEPLNFLASMKERQKKSVQEGTNIGIAQPRLGADAVNKTDFLKVQTRLMIGFMVRCGPFRDILDGLVC